MEKESLKREIEEKNKLLEDAYVALESMEAEHAKEKEQMTDEAEQLRRKLAQQQLEVCYHRIGSHSQRH